MTTKTNAPALPREAELANSLAAADYVLLRKYQYNLPACAVLPPEPAETEIERRTRLFRLERIAYDKDEDNLARLANVYNALYAVGGRVILVIESDGAEIGFYLGTQMAAERDSQLAGKTLEKSLRGNFPGCRLTNLVRKDITAVINRAFEYHDENAAEEYRVLSAVSGIPRLKDDGQRGSGNKRDFVQGLEKLIDAMRGETYTALIIADPVGMERLNDIRRGYEQLYSVWAPFVGADLSLALSEGRTVTDSVMAGVARTVSESLTLSESHSHTESVSHTSGSSVGGSVGAFGGGFFGGLNYSSSDSTTTTVSDTDTHGRAETTGRSRTRSLAVSKALAVSESTTSTVQIKTQEKKVAALLERIDRQLRRLDECADLGMWNSAAYFLADDIQTVKTAASTYQALMRGENSGLEPMSVSTWTRSGSAQAIENYDRLCASLKQLDHPRLKLGRGLPVVAPTALISGAELTLEAGLPQRSVPGLAAARYAAFGREIQVHSDEHGASVALGKIWHMGAAAKTDVLLNRESLAAHTFITGATGSGKSNAIYQLLTALDRKKIPFFVIEPAKGEYKSVFGRMAVSVYGTNPKKTPLLKINPFRFPADIHVLEHIDRLVEIFNVCWPMYAAMPAVLKEAVERAYRAAGWDLDASECGYAPPLYPTFADVLAEINAVIEGSAYSAEVKGNYIGSLVTRVRSLTIGLSGQIFTCDEIGDAKLFDERVIVDLSRVAAAETKALIMGVLVMRLQEYRLAAGGINEKLRHVTVLEEAHHLLRRSSPVGLDGDAGGGALLAKSVDMLAQLIAEMRTYGEGFIIADQSPNMLDLAAIRNTNTKIILRLPDMADRELCGRAANLTDEQIVELAKLPTGVAAVYQNNWLEPVLCQIDKFAAPSRVYEYAPPAAGASGQRWREDVLRFLLAARAGERIDYALDDVVGAVVISSLTARAKAQVIAALRGRDAARRSGGDMQDIAPVAAAVTALFAMRDGWKKAAKALDEWDQEKIGKVEFIRLWKDELSKQLGFDFAGLGAVYRDLVLTCLVRQKSVDDPAFGEAWRVWDAVMEGEVAR